MSEEEIRQLQRRVERLTTLQREMEARLWTLEDSRVFRILQKIGIAGNAIKARLRPGAETEARRREYRAWLQSHTPAPHEAAVAERDYAVLIAPGGRMTSNALCELSAAVKQERYEVVYADEDHGDAPLFKPGWSPELVSSPDSLLNYMGRFLVVRRDVLESAGEYRNLTDLAQKLAAQNARFHHIPKILVSFEGVHCRWQPARPRKAAETPLVSILICSRNAKILERCLDSIERRTAYQNREIVVVEHVTGEQRLLPGASYTRVAYSGRFDFATMNNLGVKSAKGEVIVFLNDDVEPQDAAWLEALVALAQRPEVGAVGALLYYPNGAIQHAGVTLGIAGYVGHPRRGRFDGGFWPWTTVTRNVSAVTGACLAMRRGVFEELGGFDPVFPVNYNDVDLCLRAGRAGYQVILEAVARLTHFESRTRRRGVKWEELDRFAERWGEEIAAGDPYFNPNLSLRNEDCDLSED